MGIGKRIKEARLSKNLNQEELAKLLGVTASAVGNYETGVSHPKEVVLYKLFEILDVAPNFLFQDEVNIEQIDLTFREKKHMASYRMLNSYGQEKVDEFIEILSTHPKYRKEEKALPLSENTKESEDGKISNVTRFVDFYNLPVSAGTGVYLDDTNKEMLEIPLTNVTINADFVLRVSGDSMEPEYSDGDHILIQSRPYLNKGELGIFVLNGEGYFKEWGVDRLVSLNDSYSDIVFCDGDNISCRGKVIGKL